MLDSSNSVMNREIKLLLCACTLYVSFIYWGYLQEKITSTVYIPSSAAGFPNDHAPVQWNYPRALNVLMAATASATAAFVGDFLLPRFFYSSKPDPTSASAPLLLFAKPAVTCALASPLGYMALNYIPFPLVILAKSSKPIPVMLIGIVFYRQSYPWYKHVGTMLLCGGIVMFSYWKQSSNANSSTASVNEEGSYALLLGLFLVIMNLLLDGYTNNEQEHIFKTYKTSPFQMMKNVNFWQVIFLSAYLLFMHRLSGEALHHGSGDGSELQEALAAITHCPALRSDLLWFCLCAAVGQLTIFVVMKEFGSLMWITISITRKLFTILLSVAAFGHVICFEQWLGVAAVFSGLMLEVVMSQCNEVSSPSSPALCDRLSEAKKD